MAVELFHDVLQRLAVLLPILIWITACGKVTADSTGLDSAVELTGCAATQYAQFQADQALQLAWYQSQGAEPVPQYRAQYHAGSNGRTVILVQGFSSSPYTFNDVSAFLQAQGFTVIAPLLTGFGSTAAIANASTPDQWRASFEQAVVWAKMCNSNYSVIALSLGGAIVMDEILNHGLTGISHLVALSPFLKPSADSQLVDTLFYPEFPVLDLGLVRTELGVDPYSILDIQPPPPGAPDFYEPVMALHAMFSYVGTVLGRSTETTSFPSLAFYSDADEYMDVPASESFYAGHFSNGTRVVYPQSDEIGHSLELKSGNSQWTEMMQSILAFLGT